MMRSLAAALLGLTVLPMPGADVPKGPNQSFESASTQHFSFPPDGTIRVDRSYGYLTVEGWDEPEVQLTVTKSTDRFEDPEWKEKATELFDQIRVLAERRSDKELTISTILPRRNSPLSSILPSGRTILTPPVPPNHERGVTVECAIRVPRNSRLMVRHDNGYIWVSEVAGDIDVNGHTGDMIVMLPASSLDSIDARTRFGRVDSDLTGEQSHPFLVGAHFRLGQDSARQKIRLRMGRGNITIKAGSS
jgi:hypothetical protein